LARTLIIIKPDAVRRQLIGTVLARFEEASFKILAMSLTRLSADDARAFYAVHAERPFFDDLCTFMTSGPCVPCLIEGGDDVIPRVRALMGATDPAEADPGTIRGDLAESKQNNLVHGSDGPETARAEIEFFTGRLGWTTQMAAVR